MKNIGVFLSGCVFIGLVVLPMNLREVIVSVLIAACLFVVLQRCRERRIVDLLRKTDLATWAVAVVVWIVFLSVFFYRAWCSSAVASLVVQLHVPKMVLVGVPTVCSGLSLLFLLFVANVATAANPEPLPCMGRREVYPRWGTLLFLFVTSAVVITLCSTCSPLYPINGWVDPNSFITVGKSMIHGKVLYRDIYDHKGPLLYMLHAVAYLIARTSFVGVWLIEIVCGFGFLWYSYKSVRLYCSGRVLFLMPALAAVVYSQKSFVSGDSVEELCLPLLAYCLYVVLKALRQGGVPSLGECFVVGITAAVVFWLKFTLCGFYVGWFVVPAVILIRSKRWAQLGKVVLSIVGGLVVVSLLVLAYFAVNGALGDLYQGYFYNNIVVYGSGAGGRHLVNTSLLWGIWSMGGNSPCAVMLLGLCIVWLLRYGERRVLVGVLAMFVATYWIIFFGTTQVYYSFILLVFAPLGLIPCTMCIEGCRQPESGNARRGLCASAIACIVLIVLLVPRLSKIGSSKDAMVQYKFANIINQVDGATLLNYGFLDGGFYTVSGVVPNCKYHCKLNLRFQEMLNAQDEYVAAGQGDFVVTRDKVLPDGLYECVAEEEYVEDVKFFGIDKGLFRLYARKDLLVGD